MMEGLWTAEFGSSTGIIGGGVAVFHDGKIWGGDGTYYYIGEYKLTGNAFRATLKIFPFIEGAQSVFKTVGRELTLELERVTDGCKSSDCPGPSEGHVRDEVWSQAD